MGSASLKVAGGKLVKAKVEAADGVITSARITGDFFLHPEETLAEIESVLTGQPLNETALTAAIFSVLERNRAQLIGATPQDFAKVLLEASK
jgi:lipoate-protein ligase A